MAQVTSKFVSADYVKRNTIVELNVDETKINPIIIKSQKVYIQQVLGSSFYNHLQDAISGSTLTVNEDNLLRDYIQPALAEYVVYDLFPFLNYKATNKSIAKQSSEWSEASALDEIKYLRNSIRDMAEYLTERLAKYLCDHSSLFPLYQNPNHPQNVDKNGKVYFNGIYIPKRINKNPEY